MLSVVADAPSGVDVVVVVAPLLVRIYWTRASSDVAMVP